MDKINLNFKVNGEDKQFSAYPMDRLLDVIRQDSTLTGTKEGCGEGECGACSIFLNGELVNSCLIPVAQVTGQKVETIESIADKEVLSKIQQAFLKYGGAQCGICTPGMILAATDLLKKNSTPTMEDIRDALAGNLCRCTGYTKIFESVVQAIQGENIS